MNVLRLVLFPFSLLYGLIVIIRNMAYDIGIFKESRFALPVISVGNLAIGGSGKSPMTEYLVRLLKDRHRIATLSRGYGRLTKGYFELGAGSGSAEAGDEPVQFKQKFPEITVAVCEKRVFGIEKLKNRHDLIILDDAYQHRAVVPGLSLLLFDYNSLFEPLIVLPAGNLREPFSGRRRADIIIITKAPGNLPDAEKQALIRRIKPFHQQTVFFSSLRYGMLTALKDGSKLPLSVLSPTTGLILLTGIANPQPLLDELKSHTPAIIHQNYPDHHRFSKKNIAKLAEAWHSLQGGAGYIITTEKDAQRLRSPELKELLDELPVYYLPVEAIIHPPEAETLNTMIEQYVAKHLQHS